MDLKSKVTNRWLLIAAGTAVGLLAADRLLLTPLVNHWRDQGQNMAALSQSIDQGEQLLEREASIRERWEEMKRRDLPEDVSTAENEVLKAASRWARESRVTFTSLVPQWRNHDGYQTLECRASASGDMRGMIRFLRELEQDPLAVRLDEMELTSKEGRGRQMILSARFSALRLPSADKPKTQ